MNKLIVLTAVLYLLSLHLFTVENIVLKETENYLEKLINNGLYFKFIRDVEYDNGLLYLLDFELCTIFVVDFKSGKLVRTLFRRGQGPGELMRPMCLIVKNQKVFVLDQGFNGIKIVDFNGKLVNEFKTKGMVGRRNIDVSDKNEIFVGEYNTQAKTYVSVYNKSGEKKRSLIKIDPNEQMSLQRINYNIMLDHEGNILLLFNVLRELKKFNSFGKLIWEIKIKNKILDKGKDEIKITDKRTIISRLSVFDFQITENDNILIGHRSGGCVYDKNGALIKIITFNPRRNLNVFEIIDTRLINILVFGEYIEIYDIREVLK